MTERRSILVALVALVALALGLAGCSNDSDKPTSSGPHPPQMPPASSMEVNLGLFEDESGGANGAYAAEAEPMTKFNWFNAVVRLVAIHTFVKTALTPPALAFALAVHTPPSLQEDGFFMWIYTWTDGRGHEVQIHLRGGVEGDHVLWELFLSDNEHEPPLDQALWFWGQANFAGTEGFWIFHDLDAEMFPEFARIEWSVVAEDDRRLVITNIGQDHEDFGDSLTYQITGTTASVVYFNASEEMTADITWDTETEAGSLRVPDYNGGQRACWDTDQNDVECPGPAS